MSPRNDSPPHAGTAALPRLGIGLMSGTSADGIDAALVRLQGSGAALSCELIAFETFSLAPSLRSSILQLAGGTGTVRDVTRLNGELGHAFAGAALEMAARAGEMRAGRVEFVASHGQTVCHLPGEGVTLQLGCPNIIAALTGLTVVADFRPADMAQGGQGAPLVPYADWVLLRHAYTHRIVQNIGGIANCTVVPAGAGLNQVRAWDTGPGNMILDACCRKLLGKEQDEGGRVARTGRPHAGLLARWLGHPFYAAIPPKTAGHEQFGAHYAEELLNECAALHLTTADILATATVLTAASIAASYRDFVPGFSAEPGQFEVVVGGGGVWNQYLMEQLARAIAPARLLTHEDAGLNSDAKEACAFAILGHETLNGVPTSVPGATGARRAAILGKIVPAPPAA